uniref:Uncharacterized protein n=1 Tax=Echeneis naucrates TaxID=173247 RepID=A0A665VMV5_ECHNA
LVLFFPAAAPGQQGAVQSDLVTPKDTNVTRKRAEIEQLLQESVISPRVTAVSAGWMLDFMFVSLCRRFEERQFDQFNEALSPLAMQHCFPPDVQFEQEEEVMPLMSATKIWSKLEDTVADKSVFKNVATLLIQLFFFFFFFFTQQNLRVKLTTVVTKRDTYHPFLRSFSFSRLLETIQSYLDIVDFKSYHRTSTLMFLFLCFFTNERGSGECLILVRISVSNFFPVWVILEIQQVLLKMMKLLSTKMTDLWNPESCKKPCVSLKRLSKNGKNFPLPSIFLFRAKYVFQLDSYLKAGVRRHGLGKWSRILQDYDFEGRTGTMLKDRWRVLLKAHEVS